MHTVFRTVGRYLLSQKKTIQGAKWPCKRLGKKKLFRALTGLGVGENWSVHLGGFLVHLRHSLGRGFTVVLGVSGSATAWGGGGFTWGFLEGGPGATAWADYRVILERCTRTGFFLYCPAGPIFDKFYCTAQELSLLCAFYGRSLHVKKPSCTPGHLS